MKRYTSYCPEQVRLGCRPTARLRSYASGYPVYRLPAGTCSNRRRGSGVRVQRVPQSSGAVLPRPPSEADLQVDRMVAGNANKDSVEVEDYLSHRLRVWVFRPWFPFLGQAWSFPPCRGAKSCRFALRLARLQDCFVCLRGRGSLCRFDSECKSCSRALWFSREVCRATKRPSTQSRQLETSAPFLNSFLMLLINTSFRFREAILA